MTRALITQMLGALRNAVPCDSKQADEQLYAITAAREYLATEQLSKAFDAAVEIVGEHRVAKSLALPSGERAELIEKLRNFAREFEIECHVECIEDAADMLEADAQQAKQVPMSDVEIYTVMSSTVENPEPLEELIGCAEWPELVDVIRRIEAHHGIGGEA